MLYYKKHIIQGGIDMSLKDKLRFIQQNNNEISYEEIKELLPLMLDNIGSIDFELRDDLIYSTFYNWIVNEKLSNEDVKEITKEILSESKMFYHIGESGNDTVFTRSFSVLLIPLLLYIGEKNEILEDNDVVNIHDKLTEYFELEKDYRGFLEDKGWAHAIAHTADAIKEIARFEIIDKEKLIKILELIREKISIDSTVYSDGEDERIVLAVYEILKRDLISKEEIEKWIESFANYEKKDSFREDFIMNMNIKNFLRSLYFRIHDIEELNYMCTYIKNTLDKIDRYKR